MNHWLELTRAALLGTHRTPPPDLEDESPLGRLLGAMAGASPEQTLLQMAGTLDLYEQIGWRTQSYSYQPSMHTLSPHEERRPCSPALAARLAGMLDGRYRDMLHECLKGMKAANLQLPPALLPDFLERGQKTALFRSYLLPVLGENGRWLASHNPAWAYASPDAATWDGLTKQWHDGGKHERQALLRQLRHINPVLGGSLMASSWKAETAPNRVSFMRIMETGLSMADEPFLEMALDDREAPVRRKAAELLACLSESRLCQRMIANSQQLLSYNPAQKYQILPNFPIPINDEMVRDGVIRLAENLTGNALARARSRQLTQIVGAIPLDYWTETWQTTPETIIQAALTSRWPRTLTQALAVAVQRQRHVVWAVALASHADFMAVALKIVPILTPAAGKQLLQQFRNELDEGLPPLGKDSPLLKILRYWPHDWSAELVTMWTEFLARQVHEDEKPSPLLRTTVKQFARACQPDCVDEVITAVVPLSAAHPGWKIVLNEMVRILRFRREMYEEME